MILSKKMEWVLPYVFQVQDIVPINQITRISMKKTRPWENQRVHAMTTKRGRKFSIVLMSHPVAYYSERDSVGNLLFKFSEGTYSRIDHLTYLAHELAHMIHWEHTPEHKILECELLKIFMGILKSEGYISEEHENKTLVQ